MNSRAPRPTAQAGRNESGAASRSRAPAMSARQTEAYLLARDAVRRVRRTSSLVSAILQRPTH